MSALPQDFLSSNLLLDLERIAVPEYDPEYHPAGRRQTDNQGQSTTTGKDGTESIDQS